MKFIYLFGQSTSFKKEAVNKLIETSEYVVPRHLSIHEEVRLELSNNISFIVEKYLESHPNNLCVQQLIKGYEQALRDCSELGNLVWADKLARRVKKLGNGTYIFTDIHYVSEYEYLQSIIGDKDKSLSIHMGTMPVDEWGLKELYYNCTDYVIGGSDYDKVVPLVNKELNS